MGRFSKRLPVFSSNSELPEFVLSNDQWHQLQNTYERELPTSLRPNLDEFCTSYLRTREAELHAGKMEDALARAKWAQKIVEDFSMVAHGLMRDGTDAGTYASSVARDILEQQRVIINSTDLLTINEEGSGWEPLLGPDMKISLSVALSESLLSSFAGELSFICNMAVKQLEQKLENGPGFDWGDAFSQWVLDVRSVLQNDGLPISYAVNGVPTPFARMMFELHRMLPAELREQQMLSEKAMASRIRRAVAGGK